MNTQPELTEVCERCGFIVQAGWGWKDYVSFVVCNGCAEVEGGRHQAEMEAKNAQAIDEAEQQAYEDYEAQQLEEEWQKHQEMHVGEEYNG